MITLAYSIDSGKNTVRVLRLIVPEWIFFPDLKLGPMEGNNKPPRLNADQQADGLALLKGMASKVSVPTVSVLIEKDTHRFVMVCIHDIGDSRYLR
jgi:hypothetical protein